MKEKEMGRLRRALGPGLLLLCCLALAGCGQSAVKIRLGAEISVNGRAVGEEETNGVFVKNDIVYYEAGQDFTYGEGSEADGHSSEEAAAHRVVHIAKPGTYRISGSLPSGQIAVDLGEGAKTDPEAVVTLILDGVDISCQVAPAVIFYNVYECGTLDEEAATEQVDTKKAGANVIIKDGSDNTISGSYVARIYKPGTVKLNEAGTEVVEGKKLHKYDGAFYSRMSMNVDGGNKGTGKLSIQAENEGLDSELHLTINGGNILITSGNDGINTNEDGISVTTVNGGHLAIRVDGSTGEGDGIDSNGFVVINGGTLVAEACESSADSGLDADKGVFLKGGTVLATGNMLDGITPGEQPVLVLQPEAGLKAGGPLTLRDEAGRLAAELTPENGYNTLVYTHPHVKTGTYTLWQGETQLMGQKSSGGMGGPGMGGGFRPGGGQGQQPPAGFTPPEGGAIGGPPAFPEGVAFPEGMEPPEGFTPPEGGVPGKRPEMPEGFAGGPGGFSGGELADASPLFVLEKGMNRFRISIPKE